MTAPGRLQFYENGGLVHITVQAEAGRPMCAVVPLDSWLGWRNMAVDLAAGTCPHDEFEMPCQKSVRDRFGAWAMCRKGSRHLGRCVAYTDPEDTP